MNAAFLRRNPRPSSGAGSGPAGVGSRGWCGGGDLLRDLDNRDLRAGLQTRTPHQEDGGSIPTSTCCAVSSNRLRYGRSLLPSAALPRVLWPPLPAPVPTYRDCQSHGADPAAASGENQALLLPRPASRLRQNPRRERLALDDSAEPAPLPVPCEASPRCG